MTYQAASELLDDIDLQLANVVPRTFLDHNGLLPIGLGLRRPGQRTRKLVHPAHRRAVADR